MLTKLYNALGITPTGVCEESADTSAKGCLCKSEKGASYSTYFAAPCQTVVTNIQRCMLRCAWCLLDMHTAHVHNHVFQLLEPVF